MTRWLMAASLTLCSVLPLQAQQVDPQRVTKLRQMAKQIQGRVEALRELKFQHDVPKGIQTRDELRKTMMDEFERAMPKDKLLDYQRTLAKIGLIPRSLDLGKLMVDVYTQAVAGFYNPRTRRLYLIANPADDPNEDPAMKMQRMMLKMMGMSEEQIIMAHELTHALQDQHFKLLGLDLDRLANDDRMTAIKCLVEGDATVLMYDFLLKKLGLDSRMLGKQNLMQSMPGTGSKALDGAPRYIKYGMLVPYMTGMSFVSRVKERGGWAAVNKMFSDPPASMEQVLHPEKYFERDQPTRIELTGFEALLKRQGYRKLGEDTLGELYTKVLIGDHTGDDALGKRAAAGWDGDRYAAFRNAKGHTVLVFASTWDTEQDAQEFHEAYRQVQRKKGAGAHWIKRNGKDVYVLEDAPESLQQALIDNFARIKKTEETGGLPQVPDLKRETTPVATKPTPKAPFGHKVPAGWTARRTGDPQYPLVLASPHGGELKVGVLSSRLSAQQAGAIFQRMMPKKVSAYQQVKTGELPRQGAPAGHFHSFKGEKPGKPGTFQYVQIVLQGKGRLYSLFFVTPASAAQRDKPALHQFVDDFRER